MKENKSYNRKKNKNRKQKNKSRYNNNSKDNQNFNKQKEDETIYLCIKCGEIIKDITTAIADRDTNEPVHFDCVINLLKEKEDLKKNEKISYIGQGKFAVVSFESQYDTKNFNIERIIEWENREQNVEWRETLASSFTSVSF